MASYSVPCPKSQLPLHGLGLHYQTHKQLGQPKISYNFGPSWKPSALVTGPLPDDFAILKFQPYSQWKSTVWKTHALPKEGEDKPVGNDSIHNGTPDASSISEMFTQVADLVKLVDSRDIMELQLKQQDCELIIRKKEALQPPPPSPSQFMMQAPPHSPVPPQPQYAQSTAPAPAAPSAPLPALPSPAKASKSAHPPLKCPMAGTFYRSPGPGEPPFVKVGDKVQKGQVICIIEAMKLMNEIEADQSGTIKEILAEDGKPVSVDTPLFVIAP